MKRVAVLFARADSVYKEFPACDVYDQERDARTYTDNLPVVAHPPCRAWGGLRHFAKPEPGEKELALFAVEQVRRCGGVLEHPMWSTLWKAAKLPEPGVQDAGGGWTLPIAQYDFGHVAFKKTWLYIYGLEPRRLPELPLQLGRAPRVISVHSGRRRDGSRIHKGDPSWRPECTRTMREATPRPLAVWLVETAGKCHP